MTHRALNTLGAGVCNGAIHFHFLLEILLKQRLGELLDLRDLKFQFTNGCCSAMAKNNKINVGVGFKYSTAARWV